MTLDEPRRPDPDALLAEAAKAGRGRLKVFVGMAQGVGKTYEMLAQAHRRHQDGGEVLVGVVETHGPRRGSRGPARMLERDYPPGRLSTVETDPGLLEQAVVNMLENAIAYSPDSSKIEVATYEDRANMVISIEDEGPGIPQADLERILLEIRRLDEPTDRVCAGRKGRWPPPLHRQGVHRSHGRTDRRREPALRPALKTAMPAHKPRILVIDDEPQIHRFLGPALKAAGYQPLRADTAAEGLQAMAQRPPDAVVLDLRLPDIDGKQALIRARAFYEGPIVILSASHMEMDKIEALDLGADDYVEKPFHVGELLARLRAAMRHALNRAGAPAVVHAGGIEIDLIKRLVTRNGEPVHLSPREYDLLVCLASGGGKAMTHRQLLTAVWGRANAADVHHLRVIIGHLRQKLEADPAAPHTLVTEPWVGYRLMVDA